jgi:hypothetical protein
MEQSIEFAKDFEESEELHKNWWLSLSPEQRWKSNWKQIELLYNSNKSLFEFEPNRFILR